MQPRFGYAQLGDQRIAYEVFGDHPIDVVLTTGWWSSFDVEWEDPGHRLFYEQLASYARVIRFDRLGVGASDPIPLDRLPPLESFAEEIESVMDATESKAAAIIAMGAAGPVALLFAASRPERVERLVLYQTSVRCLEDDDYPIGMPLRKMDEYVSRLRENWGTGKAVDIMFPSRAGDERLRSWYAKVQRSISSPREVKRFVEAELEVDARALLPSIAVPTLVIHRTDSEISPLAWGQYIADHIEGADLVELPGGDVLPYWDHPDLTLDSIHEFLTGTRGQIDTERQLATVLFTDIVDSTRQAETVGDRRWRAVIAFHDSTSRRLVEEHGGHLVKTTGDGILATFDGPGRAIRAAAQIQDELSAASLQIRIGIHTGEVISRATDIAGVAVHLAARIMSTAQAGEILVSNTVKDLVIGSNMTFQDRGTSTLKGIGGQWHLYSVDMTSIAA